MIQIREARDEDAKGVLELAKEFPASTKLDENFFLNAWGDKLVDTGR